MADRIAIQVDLTFLTTITKTTSVVRNPHPRRVVEETKTAPDETEAHLREAFTKVNQIWSVADLQFQLRRSNVAEIELLSGKSKVDRIDTQFLAQKFPGVRGISLVVVKGFDLGKTGGSSIEEKAFCVMPKIDDMDSYARKMAHEFGHLLGASREQHSQELTPEKAELLAHFDADEAKAAGWTRPRNYNLMYEGALIGGDLTPSQIQRARTSKLAGASVAQATTK